MFRRGQRIGRNIAIDKRNGFSVGCRLCHGAGSKAHDLRAIGHQSFIRAARAIPFEHGELRMVQGAAFFVAKHRCEGKNLVFTGRQQFFTGKFR